MPICMGSTSDVETMGGTAAGEAETLGNIQVGLKAWALSDRRSCMEEYQALNLETEPGKSVNVRFR